MNFKPGDDVTLQLSEKLEIGGSVRHSAKFVSYHQDGKWATVELEKEHAGGTKFLNVPVHIIAPVQKETEPRAAQR